MLVSAIAATASITSVNVLSNKLDMESANLLLKVKAEKPNLRTLCGLTHNETELDLNYHSLGPGGAKLLAAEILVMPSLTSLSLGDNQLGDDGVQALSIGLKESKSLTMLDLSNRFSSSTTFGPKGAAALASAIGVMASLTQLDARWNDLGEEGKAVLRKAVKSRSGFELHL